MGTPPVEMQCYDLEGFKTILKLDVSHGALIKMNELFVQKEQEHELAEAKLNEALDVERATNQTLKNENRRLFDLWTEENRKRHQAENRPQMVPWLAWSVAGAALVAAGVLGIVVVAKR